MVKKRRKFLRSKILYSYFISYIGIALMALAVLSILVAWQVSDNLQKENLRVTKDKMYVAAEDIQKQVDSMRSITYQAASMQEFRSTYFKQDKYKESEMVDQLTKFRFASILSDYFFAKYQNDDTIYTSDGTTLPFEIYSRNQIEESYRSSVAERIEELSVKRGEDCVLMDTGESSALLVIPLKKYAVSGVGLNGCLCFEISEEEVESRVEQMTGMLDGTMEVYYDDILISGSAEGMEETPASLEVLSGSENVRILFWQDESGYFLWSSMFSGITIVVLLGIVLLLLVLSLFLARRQYAPIRKLAEKYKTANGTASGSELEDIDFLIGELLQKEEKSHMQLQEQYQILREQMFRLISSGGYSDEMEERLTVLNIHLDGPVFGKISCVFHQLMEGHLWREWSTAIEDLSGDGIFVYACKEGEKNVTILVSAEEEYQLQEVCEALHALFEVHGMDAEIHLMYVCRDLKQLAHMPKDEKPEKTEDPDESGVYGAPAIGSELDLSDGEQKEQESDKHMESSVKQNRKAKQAVQYINENFTKYDLSLDSIAQQFHVTSTYLCRLLKQETGISYKEYLTKLRMEEAKRLLSDPNIAIADVCQKIGYSNVSHFIKIFQKYEGTTPAKFRDQG